MGDLPPYWATADLADFFGEFGGVVEARVIGSQVRLRARAGVLVAAAPFAAADSQAHPHRPHPLCTLAFADPPPPNLVGTQPACAPQCYGFVTFASHEDAEGMLEFAQQQGVWADDRMLRVNWAQGQMPDWKVGGRRPAGHAGGGRPAVPAVRVLHAGACTAI